MFQPRQLFHRPSSAVKNAAPPQGKADDASRRPERHPAMRGLQVSPVHGHHCICGRCEQHSDAA
jgi:hypothetical protein